MTLASIWIRSRPWVVILLETLPLLALLILFNVSGLRGVDFGYHWDEVDWQVEPVHKMLKTGVLLPATYIYPSFCKWLIMWPALVHGVQAAIESAGDPNVVQAVMVAEMDSAQAYLLTARGLFIVISSLTLVWVYGAALAVRHRWWEALLAATSFGLSWEYCYHSRWVATDCILVQFAALTVFMLALFRRTNQPLWLYCAALAAGLGTGSKYTGVFLLVPVLIAGALSLPLRRVSAQIIRAAALCLAAFSIYLLTTPATVLDPFRFVTESRSISTYYMHTHGGFTAKSALHHLQIVLSYFSLAYFSPFQWLSIAFFCVLIAGGVLWLARDPRFGATVVGFPFVFLMFFCIRYRVVMVRNYLFVMPFLSLLMARGFADLMHWLPRRWLRWGLAAGLALALLTQGVWIAQAGESVRHSDPDMYVAQALDYVARRPKESFRVSPRVREIASRLNLPLPANVVAGDAGGHLVFFPRSEGPGPWEWASNDPWLTEAVFGPKEINFNWYSSWAGHDRVVVMTLEKARGTGVRLAK
jgi:hypothetical protein